MEPVGMANDFDLQIPLTYVTLKFTIKVKKQQQQLILKKFHTYEVGATQFVAKLENLSIHQCLTNQTLCTPNVVNGN